MEEHLYMRPPALTTAMSSLTDKVLDRGADPDCNDNQGFTPLHIVTINRREGAINLVRLLLLERDANMECQDN